VFPATFVSAPCLASFSNPIPFSCHASIFKPIPPHHHNCNFFSYYGTSAFFCTPFFRLSLWPSRGPVYYFSPFLIFGFVIIISTTPSPLVPLYSYRLSHRLRWSRRCSRISSTYLASQGCLCPLSHPERLSIHFLPLVSIPIIATLRYKQMDVLIH